MSSLITSLGQVELLIAFSNKNEGEFFSRLGYPKH